MRLSGSRQFAAVYAGKTRSSAGPLLIYALPNELNHPRLGLAVPRSVGTNVHRNTIKRRLREALRLMQHDFPFSERGYDLVISVRPHKTLSLAEYQDLLRTAITTLHKAWSKKHRDL